MLRGTTLGSLLGVLPGGGALLASFAAYTLEKKLARSPRVPFGKGAIQGVAGPESANNAGAQTSFIPMLTLGIPPNAVMALMVGAMTLKGIQPGPQVMTSNPDLFWGLIASMWLGNLMLIVLNLPLIEKVPVDELRRFLASSDASHRDTSDGYLDISGTTARSNPIAPPAMIPVGGSMP